MNNCTTCGLAYYSSPDPDGHQYLSDCITALRSVNEGLVEGNRMRIAAERDAAVGRDEIARLDRWKTEALTVLADWDKVAAEFPKGQLGLSVAKTTLDNVHGLNNQVAALQMTIRQLVTGNNNTEALHADAINQLRQAEADLATSREKVCAVESNVAHWRESWNELHRHKQALQDTVADLNRRNTELTLKVEDYVEPVTLKQKIAAAKRLLESM